MAEPGPRDSERRPVPPRKSPDPILKRLVSRKAAFWVVVASLSVLLGVFVFAIVLSFLREPGSWDVTRWLSSVALVLPLAAALITLLWYGRSLGGAVAERSRAEDSFRTVASTMADGIVTIDDHSRIQFVNDAVGRIFGYTSEELLGKELTVLMPERLRSRHRAGIQRYTSTGRRSLGWESIQFQGRHKDGREIPLEISIGEHSVGGERVLTGIVRDITERKQAEQARGEAQRRLAAIVEESEDAIYTKDLAGTVLSWNAGAERIYGYTAAEAIGQSLSILFPPERIGEFTEALDYLRRGEKIEFSETVRVRKDGRKIIVSSRVSPIRDSDGRLIGGSTIARDITERKKAEVESSRIAQELTNLIDTANAPIFGIDRDGRVTEWNRTAAAITGYEKKETLGHRLVEEFITREYQTQVKEVLDKALKGNETANYEFPLYTKNGDPRDVLLNATTRRDVQGNIIGVIGVGQDITDRKKAEVESSRIAQELTNLIDTANAPIFGIDRDGRVTEWNRTAVAITGYEKRETLGRNLVEDFITEEYKIPVKEVLDKALMGNETANFEFPLYTKKRDRRDVLLNATTRRDVQGNIIGVIGVGQDITERRRVEQALEESEAKFRGLVESAPDGIFVVDATATILDMNPAGERLIDRPRTEVVGHPLTEFILPERTPHFLRYVHERIYGTSSEDLYEGAWVAPSGRPLYVQLTSQVVQKPEASLVVIVRDVTEQQDLQRKLVESERWASMGRLASFVAHEINTPLTNISLLTASLARRVADPDAQERLKKISVQGKIAASITQELLRFARPGAINPVDTDLTELVKGAVEQAEVFRKPTTELRTELGTKPVVCAVDPLRIHEVVVNLLKNAYEATRKGRVKVLLEDRGPFVTVSVADTGSGIPPDIQSRLFEPFFTTKKKGEGTGLGLAISRSFVVSHGGDITLTSEVGKGSTFTVLLPRQPVEAPPAEAAPSH
jgi:PAS domain S-box-containing protein